MIDSPAIKAGDLAPLLLNTAPDEEWIYMAHAQGRDRSAKLRAVRDHLLGCFGTPPYWDLVGLEETSNAATSLKICL